eukprot:g1803.t1
MDKVKAAAPRVGMAIERTLLLLLLLAAVLLPPYIPCSVIVITEYTNTSTILFGDGGSIGAASLPAGAGNLTNWSSSSPTAPPLPWSSGWSDFCRVVHNTRDVCLMILFFFTMLLFVNIEVMNLLALHHKWRIWNSLFWSTSYTVVAISMVPDTAHIIYNLMFRFTFLTVVHHVDGLYVTQRFRGGLLRKMACAEDLGERRRDDGSTTRTKSGSAAKCKRAAKILLILITLGFDLFRHLLVVYVMDHDDLILISIEIPNPVIANRTIVVSNKDVAESTYTPSMIFMLQVLLDFFYYGNIRL